jgi:arylformamidase
VFVQFSYSLEPHQIVMPGPIDPPEVIPRSRMVPKPGGGSDSVRWDSYNNTSFVRMFVHTGTHMDVNFHVDPDGFKLGAFGLGDFVAERPVVLQIPKGDMEEITVEELHAHGADLRAADFLFVYTGYSQYRNVDPERYVTKQPSFSVAAAEYLMKTFDLKGVCVDLMGIENIGRAKTLDPQFPVHKAFLKAGRKFYLVEDANLGSLSGKKLVRSFAIPLLLPDAEGMMVTGFAEVEGGSE